MNLEEEKAWLMSKKAEMKKLAKSGAFEAPRMARVATLMAEIGGSLNTINDEELSKSGISSASVLRSMDEAKKAFAKFDQELRGAYRELLKGKLKELEEGKLNVS